MSRRLRILVFTPSLPYPPIWGFGIRVYQTVRHLAARHEVSLLTYAGPEQAEHVARLRQECHAVHVVPPPCRNRRLAQLVSLASSASFLRADLYSEAMQSTIDALLRRERFDIIQVESSHLGGFDFHGRATLILDEHNIEYELLQRMVQTERAPLRRLFNWAEYRKFRREEQGCWDRADGVVMTSERERDLLRGLRPDKPAVCAPNGVDIEYFRPPDAVPDPGSVVLTGLMRYRPNIDAALFFAQDVLPRIRRVRPDVVFTVVGAGPPEEIKQLAGPHIVVTDMVPDVRPYIRRAAALVVPLRMGSGTRLKVLEGLAMGKAMVSTSVGCEGIAVRDGEHLLIADDADAFARAVLRLLDDRDLAAALGRRGRTLAEREYSWESVVAGLEAFYGRVLAHAPQARRVPDAVPPGVPAT